MCAPLSSELEVTCLVASQRVVEYEWIDAVRLHYGNEAAHWFAQGMGVESEIERRFNEKIREVENG